MKFSEAIHYLYNSLPVFHNVGGAAYKPGLDNSIRLMNVLQNPQNTYKTIHIAGTNGKGSVSHFLAAVLQSEGYSVGLYTSPHLVDFEERIKVNGKQISKRFVSNFVDKHRELLDEIKPSFFETTMAMAFDYFAYQKVDIAVIEVGMGGRLDSTNIITPILSVITNIGFDHTQFLGDTLEKIAFEKAGIIKSYIPVVVGESVPETKKVFSAKAKQEHSPIYFAEEEMKTTFNSLREDGVRVKNSMYGELTSALTGLYQVKNINTLLAAVKCLNENGFFISKNSVKNGLKKVVELTALQGRWQILHRNPTIVADTGHNKEGIKWVMEQLALQKFSQLHIVIGMVNDKDISGVLSLLPHNAIYYFTNAAIQRALPAEELKKQAEKFCLQGNMYVSVKLAVKAAIKNASVDDFIFIGGSNFIVGEALSINSVYF